MSLDNNFPFFPRPEEDSGFKESSRKDSQEVTCWMEEDEETDNDVFQVIRRLEEEDDEKIEEMIDDISTNEMFGSSILSNGDGDN